MSKVEKQDGKKLVEMPDKTLRMSMSGVVCKVLKVSKQEAMAMSFEEMEQGVMKETLKQVCVEMGLSEVDFFRCFVSD